MEGDGDMSTAKLVLMGTVLSLAEIAQFAPEIVLPLESKSLWNIAERKIFTTLTDPAPTLNPLNVAIPRAVSGFGAF